MARSYPLTFIRNIGIIAHIDAGKTTVTERILYYTGHTYKIGGVDEGIAVMDFMELERARGITINAAATTCYWQDYRVNIIDTPGHVDFTAEVERSLRVLDGGVVVFDGVAGVEAQSETVWRQANGYHVPRICFINKMDRVGANYYRTLTMIEQRLKARPIPVQIPLGNAESFQGVIDLVENRAWIFNSDPDTQPQEVDIPAAERENYVKYRQLLMERLAEEDDGIMQAYLEDSEVSADDLRTALRKVTLANKGVPILCGSALRNIGIQPLLNAVLSYLPSPIDMPPVKATNPKSGEPVIRSADDAAPFAALAFKVVADPFVGRLVYFRVYSGRVEVGGQVMNSTRKRKERIGRLLLMQANHREELTSADTGAIVATLGLKETFTGDTLCSSEKPVLLETIHFPEPVVSIAIEPKTRVDQERLVDALQRLAEEDPTFKVTYNQETGQTIISGMGELHLEVVVSRLVSEYRVAAKVGKPQVAYRETITVPVKAEGKFVRQSGGHGQYGHIVIELEPLPRGSEFQFEDRIRGAAIPKQFIPAAKAGIKEAMQSGVLAGYPLVDIKAILRDGSYHEVDSSEIAFKMAGSMALKNGVKKARPVLLEPVMKMEVVTPKEFLGDIISDISSRRGQIEAVDTDGELSSIRALIPLSETFGYATTLRSLTQGRGTQTLEFSQYQEVPPEMAEELTKKVTGGRYA